MTDQVKPPIPDDDRPGVAMLVFLAGAATMAILSILAMVIVYVLRRLL